MNYMRKSDPETIRARKVERVVRDIDNKPINDDNHIIGIMRVWRPYNNKIWGGLIAHRGVLLVTGNFKIDNSIDSIQQEQQLNRFLKKSPVEKKLRFHIIDYKDNSKVVIERVDGYDNVFVARNNLSFNNSFTWKQEQEIFKIYSYQMTISQAVDLMQRTADGENGQIGKQKTEYSTFNNNCIHQQKYFMDQVRIYEFKMRNRREFDGNAALKNIIKENQRWIRQVKIFELPNLWLGAVVFKPLFGYFHLNIKIALKDYKPFIFNYGQIEFLEMKDKNMRIQQCQEIQINIEDYNGSIENLELVKTLITHYENQDHPYSAFLDNLKQIEY